MQYLLKAWPTIIELMSVYKRLREFESSLNNPAINIHIIYNNSVLQTAIPRVPNKYSEGVYMSIAPFMDPSHLLREGFEAMLIAMLIFTSFGKTQRTR